MGSRGAVNNRLDAVDPVLGAGPDAETEGSAGVMRLASADLHFFRSRGGLEVDVVVDSGAAW